MQTWLKANGGIYSKGELVIKDSKGKLTKATLNWNYVKHIATPNNDFYEVPFVFITNDGSSITVLTENESMPPTCTIIFQKAHNGSIVANVKLSALSNDALTKAYQTKQYYKMDLFNNLNGNRQAYYIWQKASDTKPNRVYAVKNSVNSSNSNLSTFSDAGSIKTMLEDNCMYFVSNNYGTDCWADGGEGNGTTCATVVVSVTLTSFCFSDGGGGNDYLGFDYGEYYNTNDGNFTKKPTIIDTIMKNFTNHCIDSVFERLSNDTLKSKLAKMIGTFCTNQTIKVTINEVTGLPSTTFAETYGTGGENYNIDLNIDVLPRCSQELIALTFFHEAIHAYLKNHLAEYDFVNNPDHIIMLETFYGDLVKALIEVYPNISKRDAYCLSLLGLHSKIDDSDAIKTQYTAMRNTRLNYIKSKYPELDSEEKVIAVSDSYDNTGTKGTRTSDCN